MFLVGCGDYTRTVVLPVLRDLYPKAAIDFNYEIITSRYFAHFEIRANDFNAVLALDCNDNEKLAVIASYHSYHATQAAALLNQPRFKVIVEKPPCVTFEDLRKFVTCYDSKRIFVGYNRRYIPWNQIVKETLATSQHPVVANIIVTETQITKQHWYFAPMQGTRICGNLCHWIDLAIYWMGRRPKSVHIVRNEKLGADYSSFGVVFDDGSIFNFTATDLGDGTRGVQEYIHIKSEEIDIRIQDYIGMRIWNKGRVSRYWSLRRDKGHRRMYEQFAMRALGGQGSSYSKDDLIYSTLTYLSLLELFNSRHDSASLDYGQVETHLKPAERQC
jgi:predicted dehydrogenase